MDFTTLLTTAAKISAEAIQNYGPIAWETTLWLIRIDAFQYLGMGALFLLISIGLGFLCKWSYTKNDSTGHEGYIPVCVFSCIGAICSLIPALVNLLNVWNWVGVFWPELYLAKIALDKVL